MAEFTLDTHEFDELMQWMETLADTEYLGVFEKMAEAVGVAIDQVVRSKLPPEPSGKPMAQYWTPRQRRWWWATMRAKAEGRSRALPGWKARYKKLGGIKVLVLSGSYRRTGGIRKLAYEVQRQGGTEVVLRYGLPPVEGEKLAYLRYVIDEEEQSEYHKGTWTTLEEFVRTNTDRLTEIAAEAGITEIKRLRDL